jgi:hypothetical protein
MSTQLNFTSTDEFHDFALKNWIAAVNNGDFERAIAFDQLHYNELVKKYEDVGYWDRWQADTLTARHSLAEQFERISPLALPEPDGRNRFLIVHHNFSGLAHETQLARNMAWLRTHGIKINVEIAYLFGKNVGHAYASTLYGVPLNCIHYLEADNYQQAGERLNLLAQRRQAQGIIYPSIFFMAYWMSLLVSHGNQKFVKMKYYPLHSGRIRHWFGGYHTQDKYYQINGYDFEQLPILDLKLDKRDKKIKVKNESLTIGSISRPEKIANQGYNQFIFDVLENNPSITYLYTGRYEDTSVIPEKVRKHSQSEALGWVDPSVAVSRFSIYLEPFPWGGGEMTLLALESGLPYLTLETKENLEVGFFKFIKYIAENRDPLLQFSFCRSIPQLEERIEKLSADPYLRHQLGQAWRQTILDHEPKTLGSWISLFND